MTAWPGILTLFPTILAIILSTAGIISVGLAADPQDLPCCRFICAWRAVPGGAVLLFTEGVFSNLAAKQLMAYLSVPGWFIAGTAYLFFALNFSGLQRSDEKWTTVLLWTEPLIGLALAMTNSLHGWMWKWKRLYRSEQPLAGRGWTAPVPLAHGLYGGDLNDRFIRAPDPVVGLGLLLLFW